ncbi:MAG: glutamate racemase [Myxococcota bacterium]|nr:glutamate racemase [Myxococcota bacterium]
MKRAAIGIFDSGIGGLTVASEVVRQLPHEDVVYLGDTARLPYGTKSAATVCRYAERATELLLRYPIKAVVVACNTASAHALPSLRAMTDLPILGVVEPGARAAVAATHTGAVGIAGTEATIRSGAYQSALSALRGDLTLTAAAWPLLVPLAEEGWTAHAAARLIARTYLEPFVDADVDAIVLGCTHYPVFKSLIADVLAADFGRTDVALVDSAQAVTAELGTLLADQGLEAPERVGRRSFFCTDAPARFARVGSGFFAGGDLTAVSAVDL